MVASGCRHSHLFPYYLLYSPSLLQASSIKFSITFFDCEFNSCKAPSVKLQTLLSSISIDILISNFSQLLYYAKDKTSKYTFMSKQYSLFVREIYIYSRCHLYKVVLRKCLEEISTKSCVEHIHEEKEIIEWFTNAIHKILTDTFSLADKT